MSNRTDFPELAQELIDLFFGGEAMRKPRPREPAGLRERIATELHNAFVAGQEAIDSDPDLRELRATYDRARSSRDSDRGSDAVRARGAGRVLALPTAATGRRFALGRGDPPRRLRAAVQGPEGMRAQAQEAAAGIRNHPVICPLCGCQFDRADEGTYVDVGGALASKQPDAGGEFASRAGDAWTVCRRCADPGVTPIADGRRYRRRRRA